MPHIFKYALLALVQMETEQVKEEMTSGDDYQNSPLLLMKPPRRELTETGQVKDELSRYLAMKASKKEKMETEQQMTSHDYQNSPPLLLMKPPRRELTETGQVKDELSRFLAMKASRKEKMETEQVKEEMTSDDYQNSPLLLMKPPRRELTETGQVKDELSRFLAMKASRKEKMETEQVKEEMTSGDDYQNSPLLLMKPPRRELTETGQVKDELSRFLAMKASKKEKMETEQEMTSDDYQNSPPLLLMKPPRRELTETGQVKDELSRYLAMKASRKVKPIPQTLSVKVVTSEGRAGKNKASTEIARFNKKVKQTQASKEYLNPRPTLQSYGLSSEGAADGNKTFLASLDHSQVLSMHLHVQIL